MREFFCTALVSNRPVQGGEPRAPGSWKSFEDRVEEAPQGVMDMEELAKTSTKRSRNSAGSRAADAGAGSDGVRTKEEIESLSDDEYEALTEEEFLATQRVLLEAERQVYTSQAEMFKEEAATLARESEPGDVQFDEESGEGGNSTIERERDLALLASHLATVAEIDSALDKIAAGTYGVCENCKGEIPRIRLRALPYARLCVKCKSGGLTRR